jgi:hypothetical protein
VKKNIFGPLLLLLVVLLFQVGQPAKAGWGKLTVDSGSGDGFVVKHGLFGHKTEVHDRLGDGFVKSRSILGTKTEGVSVLGNGLTYHKGLLGFSSGSAHTMLGDNLTTHGNPLFRTTNVNLRGINSLLGNYLHGPQPASVAPGPSGPGFDAGQQVEPPPGNVIQPGNLEPFATQGGN